MFTIVVIRWLIQRQWYTPTSFFPIPVRRSASSINESDDEFNEECEDEILASVEYICSLIDDEVKRGVELNRIVVGGFSQGCAVSLVLGLSSRYANKLGAIVGLSGYLPRGAKIKSARNQFIKSQAQSGMMIFLAHGTRDMLVPVRSPCIRR